jgi:hypothetical protein
MRDTVQTIIDLAHHIKCDPTRSDEDLIERVTVYMEHLREVVEIGGFYGSSDPTQELIDSVGQNILAQLKSIKPVGEPNADTLAAAAIESSSINSVSFPVSHSLVARINEFLNKFASLNIQLCATISSIDGDERRVPHRTTVEMLSCVHAIQSILTKVLDHIATNRQLWRTRQASSAYSTLGQFTSSLTSDHDEQSIWDYISERHEPPDVEGAGTLNALILRLTPTEAPGWFALVVLAVVLSY